MSPWTPLACCLFAIAASQPPLGVVLLVLAPFLLVWAAYSLWVVCFQPARRRVQAIQLGCWLAAVAIVAGIHFQGARAAKADADAVLHAILKYKAGKGLFPMSFGDAGVAPGGNYPNRTASRVVYVNETGQPSLFYPATFTPFETFSHDFDTGAWVHNPG